MNNKLLFITTRPPYPPYDGTRAHVMSRLESLAQDWSIDLMIITDEQVSESAKTQLEKMIKGRVIVFFSPRWLRGLKALWSWCLGSSLQAGYFQSRSARHFLKNNQDGYLVYYCHTLRSADPILFASRHKAGIIKRTLLDFNDAISANYQEASLKARGLWRLIYAREKNRLLAYELRLMAAFKHQIILSAPDRHYLLNKWRERKPNLPPPALQQIPYSLNDRFWTYQYQPQNKNLVFIGNLDYPPNRQGLGQFLSLIWPLVRKKLPDSHCLIIGRQRRPRQVWPAGIKALGWLSDPYELMTKQALFFNPVSFGAGVSTKTILAMALGLPLVSTALGQTGLGLDTAATAPKSAVSLYDQKEYPAGADQNDPDNNYLLPLIDYQQAEKSAALIASLLADENKRLRLGAMLKNISRAIYLKSNNDKILKRTVEALIDG